MYLKLSLKICLILKTLTLSVSLIHIPELLLFGFLEIVGNMFTNSLGYIVSWFIFVTFGHFSPSVYDSNFYTMKFSMFTGLFVLLAYRELFYNTLCPYPCQQVFLTFFTFFSPFFQGLFLSIFRLFLQLFINDSQVR